MKIVSSIFLLLVLVASCQSPQEKAKKENKFSWNAGISAPKFYGYGGPFVEYFYQGKSIAGTSANIASGQGWGVTSGGYSGGDTFKQVPDSVFVSWMCGVDRYDYRGGFKLPRQKMIELFSNGTDNPYNNTHEEYNVIVAGMAPGGNVTIWMQATGTTLMEIVKFKAKNNGIWMGKDSHYNQFINESNNSKKYINSETNIFRYLHGVPYKIWETGDKEYNYDIGFSSKDTTNYGYSLRFSAKDGSWFSLDKFDSFIPWGKNEIRIEQIPQIKHKTPVQLDFQWYTNEDNYKKRQWYSGKIVLPQNLEDFFKTGLYKRMLIQIEKDEHKDFVEGDITLIGKNENKKIMNFKLGRYDYKLEKQLSPEYILPKGFVFPKWEGREPLKAPEFEYWQEK